MLKTSYKVEQEVDELAQEALDKYDIELEFDWNEYCTLVGQCFDLTPHIF